MSFKHIRKKTGTKLTQVATTEKKRLRVLQKNSAAEPFGGIQ
jgi:hypothetical protein